MALPAPSRGTPLRATEKGQRSYIHRTRALGDSHPGSGRRRHSICQRPARAGPIHSTPSVCLSPEHGLHRARPPSSPPYCPEVKMLVALGTGEAVTSAPRRPGEESEESLLGCGEQRGPRAFPKSQVQTETGPEFKKRKHQRLSLASRVLEQRRWGNPGPGATAQRGRRPPRPVSHSDRRPCRGRCEVSIRQALSFLYSWLKFIG